MLLLLLLLRSDEFNRVIIPVKRGEENTDYVNASFIDVSVAASVSHHECRQAMDAPEPHVSILHPFPSVHLHSGSTVVQGYRQKDSYMASQGPLQHTIEDFWRMIWEWRSCSIVMLTELEERGQVGVDHHRTILTSAQFM